MIVTITKPSPPLQGECTEVEGNSRIFALELIEVN